MDKNQVKDISEKIINNVSEVMVGSEETIKLVLTAILARGHVLIEDRPGTGKTLMAKTIAASIDGNFSRVQFTPDLMPSDITGINIYNRKQDEFQLVKGPAFTNILLADEINRAAPRTQSSLLEVMEERQVTIDGVTYPLDAPFVVMATQNSVESTGTYPLPEAQLDRFAIKLGMSQIGEDGEMKIMERFMSSDPASDIKPVCSAADIVNMQEYVKSITVSECVRRYILDIVMATRSDRRLAYGVSTRGMLMLMRTAMAYSAINGCEYVSPEDVRFLAPYVLAHRVSMPGGFGIKSDSRKVIDEIISGTEVPVERWDKRN